MDFEDEVDYDANVELRERYKNYQGLKSFKNSFFDQMTFLPDQIDRLYNFKQLRKVRQTAVAQMQEQPQFPGGVMVKLVLRNFTQVDYVTHPNRVVVVSTLFKHERKMTQMHVKFKRHSPDAVIKSKEPITIHVGFRRLKVRPIYSRIVPNCTKTKMVKEVKDDQVYLASFYFLCTYPPQSVLMFNSDFDYRNAVLMGSGEVFRCDAFQIILKRVQLTGYPFKINKRKCIARLMFFNPNDIKYFMPIDLTTKLGLRVRRSRTIQIGQHPRTTRHSRQHEVRLQQLRQAQ